MEIRVNRKKILVQLLHHNNCDGVGNIKQESCSTQVTPFIDLDAAQTSV